MTCVKHPVGQFTNDLCSFYEVYVYEVMQLQAFTEEVQFVEWS